MMLSEKPRSPVSEHRKVTKSAMEKKRRARINSSLTELKSILAGIMAYKDERFEKMEKADILEMTVNYVRQLQNKSMEKDKQVHREGDDYRSGVNSCIGEIIRLVTSSDVCDTDTKTKLLDHLANKVTMPATTKVTSLHSPVTNDTLSINTTDNVIIPPADANNNNVKDANFSTQTVPVSAYTTTQVPLNTAPTMNAYSPQMVSPIGPMPTAITVPSVQNMGQVNQTSPQMMSNVPLTILVPANFCTTAAGTTCVIPLTLSNTGSETSVVFNPNGLVKEATGNILSTSNSPINVQSESLEQNTSPPENKDLDCKKLSNVNNTLTMQSKSEIRTVPKKSAHYRNVYEISDSTENAMTEKTSENTPSSNLSELGHSENSGYENSTIRKATSPYNRDNIVWRPW